MGIVQSRFICACISPIYLFPRRAAPPPRVWSTGRLTRWGRRMVARLLKIDRSEPTDEEVWDAIRACPEHRSKSNTFENLLVLHIFQNAAVANVGDATGLRGSTTAGVFYFSLHTADPGEAGDQSTSEITYTSYARKSVARASGAGGFTVSGNAATLTDALTSFAAGTGGSGTATHFGMGTDSSGAGTLLYSGTVTPNIVTGNGVTPQLTSATSISED